jgi:transcriptional regulator with XRE-family HTH domain
LYLRRPLWRALVNLLKYQRVHLELSQESLARAAYLDQSDIAKMEAGTYVPGIKLLRRLAAVLGVPADALLKPVSINSPRRLPRDSAGRYMAAR